MLNTYTKRMGPAWIISAVACGPATLASVSTAGATYGYTMLWVVLLSAVFGTTAQYLAAKIGILSGKGIIRTTEEQLGPVWAWILTIDALAATWLAAMVLMNALSGITSVMTGVETPYWGVFFALLIGALITGGGYRWFELVCKLLVGFVVICFVIVLFLSELDVPSMLHGLVPQFPGGLESAMISAAIMGGAVHITIIGMHTYNVNARNWQLTDLGLARFDTVMSMGFAFGLYSTAIFLVSSAVLHPNQVAVKGATDAALALAPLLGKSAMLIFLVGLFTAAFSTISPTFLAGAFFLADRMHWQLNVSDKRFRGVVWAGCLLSMLGPFIKGSFFLLLPLMLALGLTGTPVIIAIILYLLNRPGQKKQSATGIVANLLGAVTLVVTLFLAVRFVAKLIGG
ncbi:MAG: Mn2+/Fe2 transporter [Proteobacteria bacterium]|nr:MAG: Mn2+/Fe2 transporter [Pseudomonadota bacterium]PIE65191.1 MAG: Mn2+/Fe2 transporter [Desulfobacterales bacterium]